MNERIIRALPRDVADKIAAGEVVERPLSIVKDRTRDSLPAPNSQRYHLSLNLGFLTHLTETKPAIP